MVMIKYLLTIILDHLVMIFK